MYEFFSIILFIISSLLITLITINPNKKNIMESSITLNNNTVMTPKYIKNTLNYSITILAILFYLTVLTLNIINNNNTNKLNNNNYNNSMKNN